MRCLLIGVLLLPFAACGGGVGVFNPMPGGPVYQGSCAGGPDVLMETDEQAYLQLGGAFDQLRHDEGPGNAPIKMTTKIDAWIRTKMCQERIPGVALGIVWQGNIVYVKGYGLARGWETASVADDEPVRGQRTRFRWASVSKCVTGLASVIASQELGGNGQPLFDLDADLLLNYRCAADSCAYDLPSSYYLGWMENMEADDWPLTSQSIPEESGYEMTPRRLLAHRCGVMHYGEGDPAGSNGVPSEAQKMANDGFVWAINEWSHEPLVRLPATTYNYSSFGMNMAGAALHFAVPGGFWGYVKSRIADVAQPVPMQYFHPDDVYDPQYAAAPWWTAQDRIHGYTKNAATNDVVVNTTPGDVSYKLPGGGFISTVADLTLFANGLLNNHFLDQAGMDLLWTPQAFAVQGLPGAPATGYALGYSVSQYSGERMVSHSGSQQDARSQMILFPDGEDPAVGKLGVVVMSNAEYCDTGAIALQVEAFLRNPYVEETIIVFAGTTPRNLAWAQEDTTMRLAPERGPFVDAGQYLDPDLDRYSELAPPAFQVRSHVYNPGYRTAPAVPSSDPIPEEDDREGEPGSRGGPPVR